METTRNKANVALVAFCGLYCGACRKLVNGKCPGCAKNIKASWCKVRTCNIERGQKSCAECTTSSHRQCKHMNNMIAKTFALVFNSDRNACIDRIKNVGLDQFAFEMHESGKPSIKRK